MEKEDSITFSNHKRVSVGDLKIFRETMETNLEGWKKLDKVDRENKRNALEQLMDFLDAHPQTGNYQWWRDRFGTPMSIGV